MCALAHPKVREDYWIQLKHVKLNGVQLPWPLGRQWQQETDCQDTEEIGSWLASLLKPEAHAYAEVSSTTVLALQ